MVANAENTYHFGTVASFTRSNHVITIITGRAYHQFSRAELFERLAVSDLMNITVDLVQLISFEVRKKFSL